MDFGFSESNNVNMRFGFLNQGGNGFDPDALQFVANWEIDTGVTMPTTQRLAINDFYRGLKGEGTSNGSDLWTLATSVNARIFPLIPLDDTNANALAYSLDAVSNGIFKGTYNNFVSGDFTAQGVIGGVTKYFNSNTAQSFYNINDVSAAAYCRTDLGAGNQVLFGLGSTTSTNSILLNPRNASDLVTYRVNDSVNSTFPMLDSSGWFLTQRSGGTKEVWKDGVSLSSASVASTSTFSRMLFFHAYNNASAATFETTREICCYMFGLPYLTSAQSEDLYTVIQRLQSNVITGGRQIGTSIPPIS